MQIAKASGARVTGVCSTTKVDLVRSIGADHVIEAGKVTPIIDGTCALSEVPEAISYLEQGHARHHGVSRRELAWP